jgi:hypothetical protein
MIAMLLAVTLTLQASANEGDYLYRTLMLRAAPGELLEVIDLYVERMPTYRLADGPAFMMRHSQGDHWDLLMLFPMGSFADYYTQERIFRRAAAGRASRLPWPAFERAVDALVAWREELFVVGPPPEVVAAAFADNSYYHVEMFVALPGQREALLKERRMENRYLAELDRPQNLIFQRVAGAAWDSYTIGFYRDIKHYAASADIPDERKEAAARTAGFAGADRIGSYLRTLIQWHRDTLATAIARSDG